MPGYPRWARATPSAPCPDLVRASTPSFRAVERLAKTWVPTDPVRGLKAHGTGPATGAAGSDGVARAERLLNLKARSCCRFAVHAPMSY
jgi:hypothetical protein